MEFSARFKQLRKESGLTQQDIANVVFVDKTTVSKWELGANYPNQNVQTALADFFKVSVDYLLGRTDIRNANITPPSEAVIDMPIIGSVRGGLSPANASMRFFSVLLPLSSIIASSLWCGYIIPHAHRRRKPLRKNCSPAPRNLRTKTALALSSAAHYLQSNSESAVRTHCFSARHPPFLAVP